MTGKKNYKDMIIAPLVLVILGYFIFLTQKVVAQNYEINQKIAEMKNEIEILELEKQYLENLNVYYSSDTYKELEARRKLGLKKSGEKVIRIPISEERINEFETSTTIEKVIEAETELATTNNDMSNARKWIKFVLRF